MRSLVLMTVFAIVLFGCTSTPTPSGNFSNLSNYTTSKIITITDCEKLYNHSIAKDECILNSSVHALDALGCGKVFNLGIKDECFSRIANSTGTISLCDNVTRERARLLCLASLPEGKTALYNCLKLPIGERDGCYHNLALEKANGEYCLRIVNKTGIDECLSKAGMSQMNITLCSRVVGKRLRDDCTYYFAISTNDTESCGKINSEAVRDDCRLRLAVAKMDESICAEISGRNLMNSCFESIAQIKGVPGLCERISQNTSMRDGCYYYFMEQKRDIGYCTLIAVNSTRDECTAYMAQKNNNITVCFGLTTSLAIDECIHDYGSSHKNATYCLNIENLRLKDSCLALAAAGSGSIK
ncbi:MAG TPA: hypothetical protein VJI13_00425 [Candidatus Norongarragalinales archaeon]|nr:hypothetical protein [Candidatus Norongarragalinales archaeon]